MTETEQDINIATARSGRREGPRTQAQTELRERAAAEVNKHIAERDAETQALKASRPTKAEFAAVLRG